MNVGRLEDANSLPVNIASFHFYLYFELLCTHSPMDETSI